jgi:RNA recognition motif-containing protein
VEFKSYRSCQKAIKELNQSTYKGRTIVLDFSVSKQRFMTTKLGDEEEQEKMEEEQAPKEEKEEKKEEKKEGKKGKKGKKEEKKE